jgi:hypothetical protein
MQYCTVRQKGMAKDLAVLYFVCFVENILYLCTD